MIGLARTGAVRVASLSVGIVLASCGWQGVLKHDTALGWGGRGISISVDPTDQSVVWVGSPTGGVFKSGVGGAAWGHVDQLPEFGCFSIKHAPSDHQTIIATFIESTKATNSGGVWVSTDGGKSWSQPPSSVARDGNGAPRRYSAYGISFQPNSRNVYVGTDSGFVVSTDLGMTWQFINPDPLGTRNSIFSILALGNSKVLTYGNSGVWISDDGRTMWYHPTNPLIHQWSVPNALAVSPWNENHLFFANAYQSLFYSTDGGHNWKPITADFKQYDQSRQVYVKVVKSRSGKANALDLYYAQRSDVARKTITWNGADFDFSQSWQELPFLHSDPADLAFGNDGNTPLYAANDGGVERSADGGATWIQVGNAAHRFDGFQVYDLRAVLALDNFNNNDIYFGTQDDNLYASGDNGTTWPGLVVPEGGHIQAPPTKANATYSVSDFDDQGFQYSDPLYANLKYTSFPFPAPDAIYYVRDRTFATLADDGMGGLGLFVSTDGCKTWSNTPILSINQSVFKYGVVSGPSANPSLIVPFQVGATFGLLRIDGAFNGVVNDETVTPLPLPPGANLGTYGFQWRSDIVSFGVDPNDPNFIILPDVVHDMVYVTTDGGTNWTPRKDVTDLVTGSGTYAFYLPGSNRPNWELADAQVSAIAFDPANSSNILIGTAEAGIFFSSDHGHTWGKVPDSQTIPNVTSFGFLQTKIPQEAYVSSWGRGLWTISLDVPVTNQAGFPLSGLFARWQRPSTIPGDKRRARELYADTLSPRLLIEGSRTRTASSVVPAERPIRLTGSRWLPSAGLRFELDGREIRLAETSSTRSGTFAAVLPAFQAPGRHTLRVSQQGVGGQRKEATIRFNVAIVESRSR